MNKYVINIYFVINNIISTSQLHKLDASSTYVIHLASVKQPHFSIDCKTIFIFPVMTMETRVTYI